MNTRVVGVEIGGTKLQVVLGTSDGAILLRKRGSVDPDAGAKGILTWIEQAIESTLSELTGEDRVSAIGVGFGGPVHTATGKVLTSHQVAGWDGIALKSWLTERFQLPVVIENDANAAGWAEYCHGAGHGTQNFVYCNIGSGIGGAFVANGALYNGQGYGACEIGHTYVPDWTASVPGASEKLENLCSGWSITSRIQRWEGIAPDSPLGVRCRGNAALLTCPMLAEAAREGDDRALKEIEAIAGGVGAALTNVITLLHPERVALGGGVALMGDVLLNPIRNYIAQHVFGPYKERFELVPCALEEDVVTVGALLLASQATTGC